MKVDTDLIIPYSLAVGFCNLIFSGIGVLVTPLIFSFPITWKLFLTSYIIGYIILWILNIDLIKE